MWKNRFMEDFKKSVEDYRKSRLKPILPCPFCGSEGRDSYYGEYRYIICTNKDCGARSGQIDVTNYRSKGDNLDCINMAIDMWNKRSQDTPPYEGDKNEN